MALTDPIADMLTIMRNASRTRKDTAEVKNSTISENILKIMKRESFITEYKLIQNNKQGLLRIYFKYLRDGTSALSGLKRISTPGLRVYRKVDEVPKVYGGLGIAIISTSKGLMTDGEARGQRLGGEVICYVW
jgi:small subunit ribosomal protein S8